MRAILTGSRGVPWHEWIIVSRWGTLGQHLSIARAAASAPAEDIAPIQLTPRQTALAALLRLPRTAPPSFLLLRSLPLRTTVAGEFMPTEGYVRLLGDGGALQLFAEGRCALRGGHTAWRIEATRVAWVGDFVEGDATRNT